MTCSISVFEADSGLKGLTIIDYSRAKSECCGTDNVPGARVNNVFGLGCFVFTAPADLPAAAVFPLPRTFNTVPRSGSRSAFIQEPRTYGVTVRKGF